MKDESTSKGLLLILTFFALTPIALATSLYTLFSISAPSSRPAQVLAAKSDILKNPEFGVQIYASLPSNIPSINTTTHMADARVEIIRQYLSYYNSPLTQHANDLIVAADKYDLDFRLLVAIAQQESNLCKKIPPNSHNCWGWGIHSAGTLKFADYKTAINAVASGLKNEYIDKGYTTVDEIMDKWVPHSPERAWASGVKKFMEDME